MKKLLALCLTAVLCLCCLASCVSIIPHAHTEGDVWEYNENQHWKPINCVFNICEINIVSYEHVDENNDGVCDVCGYLAKIGGAFEFEYVGTEEGHCEHKVGTTCDGTCVKSPHENYDADLFCDFCGYELSDIPQNDDIIGSVDVYGGNKSISLSFATRDDYTYIVYYKLKNAHDLDYVELENEFMIADGNTFNCYISGIPAGTYNVKIVATSTIKDESFWITLTNVEVLPQE